MKQVFITILRVLLVLVLVFLFSFVFKSGIDVFNSFKYDFSYLIGNEYKYQSSLIVVFDNSLQFVRTNTSYRVNFQFQGGVFQFDIGEEKHVLVCLNENELFYQNERAIYTIDKEVK